MDKVIAIILLLGCLHGRAQVIVTPQLQKTGVIQKQQLWDMLLTNTGSASVMGHIQVVLGDNVTGQPILSGTGKIFSVAPGNLVINSAMMDPVQYTQLNPNYVIEPGPTGFLPIGNFSVCISFFKHVSDEITQIAEECDFIEVEPLSPPQLVLPWNESEELQLIPTFTWLPPSPVSFFSNLNYDFDIVEILPGQAAADAIQQNIPLLHQINIIPTSLLYPTGAPALVFDKQYAWRITAKSNGSVVSRSEIWTFNLKREKTVEIIKTNNLPYVKLSRSEQTSYVLQSNYLKFDYLNEANDSTWNIVMYDLSTTSLDTISMRWDTLPVKYGQNLVNIDLSHKQVFINRHLYLLELSNGWGEKWRMRFEFRRQDD